MYALKNRWKITDCNMVLLHSADGILLKRGRKLGRQVDTWQDQRSRMSCLLDESKNRTSSHLLALLVDLKIQSECKKRKCIFLHG